jgi:DNA-binding MarR family transcriptional regulator
VVRRSAERNRIIKALTDAAEPLGPKEIADATGLKYPNVKVMLPQMVKAGELVKAERGAYRIVQP